MNLLGTSVSSFGADIDVSTMEAPIEPISVNIYAGRKRGGLGDIVSNLLVANELVKLGMQVTVIVPDKTPLTESFFTGEHFRAKGPTVHELLPKLIDGYSSSVSDQTVGKIRYIIESAEVPISDFFLVMSMDQGIYRREMEPTLDVSHKFRYGSFSFDEYARGERFGNAYSSSIFEKPSSTRPVDLVTKGTDGVLNLYISEQNPRPSREQALQIVNKLNDQSGGKAIDKSALLAVGYTSSDEASESYVDALARVANHKRYRDKTIVAIVKQGPQYTQPLPLNLKLLTYDSLPLEDMGILFGNSDFLPIVTGDGSLTQAIQHGKVFIYEMLSGKQTLPDLIRHSLRKFGPNPYDFLLPEIWEISKFHLSREVELGESRKTRNKVVTSMYKALIDTSFRKHLERLFARARRSMSLPLDLQRLFKFSKTFSPKNLSEQHRAVIADAALRTKSDKAAYKLLLKWSRQQKFPDASHYAEKKEILRRDRARELVAMYKSEIQDLDDDQLRELQRRIRRSCKPRP